MSNHLAIAAVTRTLAAMLTPRVRADVPPATAVPGRPDLANPDDQAPAPEVRIFLYRVEPNAAWRNDDLPTRRANGDLVQRPQVALNLDYLLTFFGDEGDLVPERLLASTARALHTRPLLTRQAIRQMIASALQDDANDYVGEADLAEQPELVRFTPLSLDLEDLSKLWSVFFQTPYRLSVAYRASVVLISPDETPSRPLPVRERRVFTVTIRRPAIARVVAAAGPREPITAGATISVLGSQLRGDITRVRLGPDLVDPDPADVRDDEIRLDLPADLRAGLVGVQVVHALLMGEPPAPRPAGESNVAPMLLRPRIREAAGAFQITVTDPVVDAAGLHAGNLVVELDPPVGRTQRVMVHLDRLDPPADAPPSYAFEGPPRDVAGAPETTDTLRVPFAEVEAGAYLVRLQVDGAESPLVVDDDEASPTFGLYVAPQVVIP